MVTRLILLHQYPGKTGQVTWEKTTCSQQYTTFVKIGLNFGVIPQKFENLRSIITICTSQRYLRFNWLNILIFYIQLQLDEQHSHNIVTQNIFKFGQSKTQKCHSQFIIWYPTYAWDCHVLTYQCNKGPFSNKGDHFRVLLQPNLDALLPAEFGQIWLLLRKL